jgi:hypothetical protein
MKIVVVHFSLVFFHLISTGSGILVVALLLNPHARSFLNVGDQDSHPYKRVGKSVFLLAIFIFAFLNASR